MFIPNLLQRISAVQELETANEGKIACLVEKVKHFTEHRDWKVVHGTPVTHSHLDESLYTLNHPALL